jgi:hypothetical protein
VSQEVRALRDAVLHEGYLLYPYGRSALKNRHRYPLGTLYPEAFCRAHQAGDVSVAQLECVAVGSPRARLSVDLRFLHFVNPEPAVREAHLPTFSLKELAGERRQATFEFSPVRVELSFEAFELQENSWKLRVQLSNATELSAADRTTRDEALFSAAASAHLLISSQGAEFISLIDPPDSARGLVDGCKNVGLWPVLVGKPSQRDMLLAAPFILYDYPELAPESAGDFFDATEIDELMTLRILTLAEEEKREMCASDSRARALLERTEASGFARLSELHGRMRQSPGLRPGISVRLRPKRRADILDLALQGKRATIQAVERDFEGRTYIAVTVDEDPGKDLGIYGHRFFFSPEELEVL